MPELTEHYSCLAASKRGTTTYNLGTNTHQNSTQYVPVFITGGASPQYPDSIIIN